MPDGHAVRIVRPRATGPAGSAGAGRGSEYRPNTEGLRRASRLLIAFAVGLLATYATFLSLASREGGGLGGSPQAWVVLSIVAVALLLWATLITLGRTPRGARLDGEAIVVELRWRRARRYELRGPVRLDVVQRHPRTPWLGGPTEVVRFTDARGRASEYLVEAGLVEAGGPALSR